MLRLWKIIINHPYFIKHKSVKHFSMDNRSIIIRDFQDTKAGAIEPFEDVTMKVICSNISIYLCIYIFDWEWLQSGSSGYEAKNILENKLINKSISPPVFYFTLRGVLQGPGDGRY